MVSRSNPFDGWAEPTPYNEASYIYPGDYARCWHAALGRLAIVLNLANSKKFPRNLLKETDDKVIQHFLDLPDAHSYYVMELAKVEAPLDPADLATNFFYGSFDTRTLSSGGVRIIYHLPEGFLSYSYKGLYWPRRNSGENYEPKEFGASDHDVPGQFMMQCVTNYLLRNFWHNIVHNLYQNINRDNAGLFSGGARYESDFEADNISFLLLAYSYGLPILADRLNSAKPDKNIVHMLRRNRCNELFRLRAEDRQEEQTFVDREWRTCRTVAGYLSGWLLAQGLAAASISVHCAGNLKFDGTDFRRDGDGFGISVNGVRVAYEEPYPSSEGNGAGDRSIYLRDLATTVQAEYRTVLRKNKHLQAYAVKVLDATFARLGINIARNT
jgi:hypothetical protein